MERLFTISVYHDEGDQACLSSDHFLPFSNDDLERTDAFKRLKDLLMAELYELRTSLEAQKLTRAELLGIMGECNRFPPKLHESKYVDTTALHELYEYRVEGTRALGYVSNILQRRTAA